MTKIEPLISAEDYLAFQAMMPKEPAFKDGPTGIISRPFISGLRPARCRS